jgi:hypothetical protein
MGKVQPLPWLPPEDMIAYIYADARGKLDLYARDAQWDGPNQLVITTYAKGKDEGQRWIKVLFGGHVDLDLKGVQVFSPKLGEHDTSPFEPCVAHYYIVGSVAVVWGENQWPTNQPPASVADAQQRRTIWCTRVPLRPAI